jgi:hypothetical protein
VVRQDDAGPQGAIQNRAAAMTDAELVVFLTAIACLPWEFRV